ncbi:PQQ-dependent sugar dehydrogenase [soil metagenome]
MKLVPGGRAWALLIAGAITLAVPTHALALPPGTKVRTYKAGLDWPVDMAWVKGSKRLFFTEKNTGKIRVVKRRHLRQRACTNLDVNSAGERGALGLALDPRFKRNHHLYVYYTNASPLDNRVARFTVKNNRCRNKNLIIKGLSASSSGYHNGGQLEFVDGKLFVSTGEAHQAWRAQSKHSRLGKVLRYRRNGTVPRGNPFGRHNPVWSLGHRNPFGLTHKPDSKRLYETENGPQCDDELNRIVKGRNYGWGGGYRCGTAGVGPNPKRPLKRWRSIIVPTDAVWYRGRLRALSNSLFVGDFATGRLHRFVLKRRGTRIKRSIITFNGSRGIVDLTRGPGGWLYMATSSSILRITRR